MSATVKVDNRMNRFMAANEIAMEKALMAMRTDVYILSQFKVPLLDGELKNSGEHLKMGRLHHRVQYGENGAEDYAAYQHRGMRKDGSRRVKRYTTSGTNKGFLSDSGKIIAPKSGQYFKRAAERVRV